MQIALKNQITPSKKIIGYTREAKEIGCCWAFESSAAGGADARGKKSSGSSTRKQVISSPVTSTFWLLNYGHFSIRFTILHD
jgi:hypothetical protein